VYLVNRIRTLGGPKPRDLSRGPGQPEACFMRFMKM
jgi:hypothetical protein